MSNVLITEALSAAAHRLKNQLTGITIIMGDCNEVPAVMINSGAIRKLPQPQSPSYPHQVLTFCLDNNISTAYILDGQEFAALEPALQLFAEYGIDIQLVKNDL